MGRDRGRAYGVVEDVRPICPVIVESLVHNVPSVALPFIMCHLILDMVLQGRNKRCICP